MDPVLQQILAQFQLVGTPISCERYGFGHINVTYLVVTDQGVRYILLKILKRFYTINFVLLVLQIVFKMNLCGQIMQTPKMEFV